MNINTKSTNKANRSSNQKPVHSVETAGSLAYMNPFSYFSLNIYDSFVSSNPFSANIDYSNYADCGGESLACSGFMAGFANAVATVGTDCGGVSAGFCGGGDFGGGCSSGGFTSFV